MQRLSQQTDGSQHLTGRTNPVPELTPTEKRLLLSAHLSLVCKKLRRGLSVEEQEIRALLPFTISNGAQIDGDLRDEPSDTVAIDLSDRDWSERVTSASVLR